jgi:2-oxoisovalerate dehydrogenase E1 component
LTTSRTPGLDQDHLLALYRTMLIIRRTEEALVRAYQQGLIHGACHTYVGQEAIAVGVCAHLRQDDVVFSTHRGHGHALAKGVEARSLVAELLGRSTGCSGGRGGSMHLFAPAVGMMGTSGIVGPCILQAAGAGYSFKLLRSSQVAVAFFGDGAVQNGAFHEGLNLAAIWGLPVLFICENNQYATEVSFAYAAGNPDVGSRGETYGMPGVTVDGNDVLAVHAAAAAAVRRARAGEGATLIECKTYRTRPHAEGMGDFDYRTREEVRAWAERCPIARLRATLTDAGTWGAVERIDAEVDDLVLAAVRFAEESPWPEAATATMHVFSEAAAVPAASAAPSATRELTYSQATLEALAGEMERNPRIFVLGEGIGRRGGNFKTTLGLFDRFGALRLCDTPISERGFIGLAGGAAMTGTRPIVDFMFIDFLLDAVGEIVNQIAKMQYMSSGRLKMPVLLRGCIGIGHSAATHHSGSYAAMFAHVPGLRVVVPATPRDAKGLFLHALRGDDPVLFLEHRELLNVRGSVPEGDYELPFGQANVARTGKDVTLVALAAMVPKSLEASDLLEREGISVEVIDPRTIAPLDEATILRSVAKTGRLLIADEAFGPYGFGAEVAARVVDLGFNDLDAPIRRLCGAQVPTPYSPPLERAVVPGVEAIVQAARALAAE